MSRQDDGFDDLSRISAADDDADIETDAEAEDLASLDSESDRAAEAEVAAEDSTADTEGKDSSGSDALPVVAGNLASYIKTVNQVPMLTPDDERTLTRRLKEYGDLDAARKLIMSHLRLVVSVARGYAGYGLPMADLIQEGNIGLMKAVKHFDPDVGGRLAAFAVHWIKAEIHDYVIKNWRVVKVATTKAQRKLFFKLRQNKKRLGWFTENERDTVARDLGVTPGDVAEMETRLSGQDVGYDASASDDSSDSNALPAPSAYLEDENSNFAQAIENRDYKVWELERLARALRELDERSRLIIKRRWLDENKATLQELSDQLHVSIERVRQIENTALKKIKQIMLKDDTQHVIDVPKESEAAPAPKKRGRKKKSEAPAPALTLQSEQPQTVPKPQKVQKLKKETESAAAAKA